MTTVTAFTAGFGLPGSRFRIGQFVPVLAAHGVTLTEHHGLGSYPPARRWLRPLWAPAALAARLPGVLASHRTDVTLFQRELISTLATIERFTHAPRVLDVDDAIWLSSKGRAASRLAGWCDLVICGNSFLAEHFGRWTRRTALLPTAVDTDRYAVRSTEIGGNGLVVGWMGTSSNFDYLQRIEGALAAALEARPAARVLIVSDRRPSLPALPPARWTYHPWSADREVADLQSMTIGLMPLDDTPWARGKCSFKMLTYMACGVPVVVSPVGMNVDVLAAGSVGLAASTPAEWRDALISLLDDEHARRTMGAAGRTVAENRYSVRVLGPQLAALLSGAARP